MKNYSYTLLVVFFMSISHGYAQSFIRIYGVVKTEKNVPLSGARILFKQWKSTGATDTIGWFTASYHMQLDTIQITYPDYKMALIPINKKTKFPIHIIMYRK